MMHLLLAAVIAAKLVIVAPNEPAAVTDYPSMERCQQAAESLKDQQRRAVEKWVADTQVTVGSFRYLDPAHKSLGIIPAYPRPPVAQVYCVRG
jgi:hypothetical protein